MRRAILVALLGLVTVPLPAQAPPAPRPVLITVDDLPISGGLHPDPAERARITRDLLAALARHGIRAVGLVTWGNVRYEGDEALLDLWLEAGHELGNHSFAHLDYHRTSIDEFLADVERCRVELSRFLDARGKALRFFRFPMLDEGDTPEKLRAAREYLARTHQTNLPVTIDNQDWSFDRPWVRARGNGDEAALREVGERYQAATRISVLHHERTGDRLFDRPVPQILLLHANEIGAAEWNDLFDWLERTGHRFADADEVLADPAFSVEVSFVGAAGYGLWDRIRAERDIEQSRKEVEALLEQQAAAWNRGDLDAFGSAYADDATFVTPSGLTQGREQILTRYRARYEDPAAMGRLQFEVVEARPIRGVEISMLNDARPGSVHGLTVVARWRLAYEDREDASGLTLLVFQRGGDGWKIVQDASF